MKKIFFLMLTLIVLSTASMNAQVLIGGDGTGNPDPSAVLELQSSDQGFLPPRVALISTADPAPLAAFVNGMTVYNTASTGDVTPGTYYCDGGRWVRVRNSLELIKKSDLSGEVVKLIMDLAKTQGTVTNNCPETVVGNSGTSYKVGDFGIAGCWMIDNSKEGTPSAKQYGKGSEVEQPEGLLGYYYSMEQAAGACPEGWALPSQTQKEWLSLSFQGDSGSWAKWTGGSDGSKMAGYRSGGYWTQWGAINAIWSKTYGVFSMSSAGTYWVRTDGTGAILLSVRCVKN
jgi:uncharacterized protein (TIGR02145 family)